ncbi:MAG TPA: MFS transporter [Acidobacteriaceae bacterium]|jgi:fucose permease
MTAFLRSPAVISRNGCFSPENGDGLWDAIFVFGMPNGESTAGDGTTRAPGKTLGLQRNRGIEAASTVAFYAGFALTGICIALPGAVLPTLLKQWHLSDRGAGMLFLLFFFGSTTGCFSSRGNPVKCIAWGAAIGAFGCSALALGHLRILDEVFFAYGFAQGMLITCITRVRLAVHAAKRVQEINRLNFVWGIGAFLCPALMNSLLRAHNLRWLFLLLAVVFALLFLWMVAVEFRHLKLGAEPQPSSPALGLRLPRIVLLSTFLTVGLESATGAWIATYSHRLHSGWDPPIEAATLLWLGLLTSRALCATRGVHALGIPRLLRLCALLAASGSLLAVAAPHEATVLVAALLVGLGIGPVYPTLIATTLPRVAANSIFVAGGMGSAFFPWLTGMLSGQAGSLRIGMGVPMGAALLLLLMMPTLLRTLKSWDEASL